MEPRRLSLLVKGSRKFWSTVRQTINRSRVSVSALGRTASKREMHSGWTPTLTRGPPLPGLPSSISTRCRPRRMRSHLRRHTRPGPGDRLVRCSSIIRPQAQRAPSLENRTRPCPPRGLPSRTRSHPRPQQDPTACPSLGLPRSLRLCSDRRYLRCGPTRRVRLEGGLESQCLARGRRPVERGVRRRCLERRSRVGMASLG